jgi:acyl-coenzyme A thioesterase PaaI-like protein
MINTYTNCFVCGDGNPDGLNLKFDETADHKVSTHLVTPAKLEGIKDIMHGGLICTLLDEVMVKAVDSHGAQTVTASMEIKFRSPAFVGRDIFYEGWVEKREGKWFHTASRAVDGDKLVAEATGKYVEVPKAKDGISNS